ncbi:MULTISPECIES: peptidoglycan editing factor PgeF [Pasteurellaceae]|uniref:peptidoglycan editing factor PgeF n=1 Tax=Pasteurellaceae TaxID=712 RepID=UPI003568621F
MDAIQPHWPAPANIRAFTTVRRGGVSQAPYHSFNLGAHVGDEESAVKINRTLLTERFGLPQAPVFLNQVHGTNVIRLPYRGDIPPADAAYSAQPNQVCVVMTADCLPVLLCDRQGTQVAAAHAGWRGLCDGVLEQTVKHFQCPREDIIAWLGPAIGPACFQVGADVAERFMAHDAEAETAFMPDPDAAGKYLCDLYCLAAQRLRHVGVRHISGGEHCTYRQATDFFSFRRDKQTGRMASLIWFTET